MTAEEFGKKVLFSFIRAFLGAFLVLVPGVLAAPDFSAAKAAAISAVIAAATAAFRAIQVFFPGIDSHA